MTTFRFATADHVHFGPGSIALAPELAASFGRRALIITGSSPARHTSLFDQLRDQGLELEMFPVDREPTTALATEGASLARELDAQLVIGIGGGSALDAAKAIAALATNEGGALDYLEVIGQGKPLLCEPLPFLAIPTTAGTGAEVTRNAVLASPEHNVKVSLRSWKMLPDVAIVDPELTYSVPAAVTAATGMDALTQVIEPLLSKMANPLTDAICREGILRAARSLRRCVEVPEDAAAREDMALASLFGGLALANAKLGAVHGFAGPLGGMYDAPHGALCGKLLPQVMRQNYQALRSREPENPRLARFDEVARLLLGAPKARAEEGIAFLEELEASFELPGLASYGLRQEDYPAILEKSRRSSSMKGNPLVLEDEELCAILEAAR